MKKNLKVKYLIIPIIIFLGCKEETIYSGFVLPELMINEKGDTIINIALRPGEATILRKLNNRHFINNRAKSNIRLGGYFYRAPHVFNENQLNYIENNLDILVLNSHLQGLHGFTNSDQITEIKKNKPFFKYYEMLFATSLHSKFYIDSTMSEWLVKDVHGNQAYGVRSWPNGNYFLMDLGNENYGNWFNIFIRDICSRYNADGVFIDEIMWNGYWRLPIDQMRDYKSVEEIRTACMNWLKVISKNIDKEILHQAFWEEAQESSNGVWGEYAFESKFQLYENPIFYEKMTYKEILDNAFEISSKGNTYLWASWFNEDSLQDLIYCLGTYLLAKGSNSLILQLQPIYGDGYPENLAGYDINKQLETYDKYKDFLDINLGNPKSKYYIDNSFSATTFIREFENGLVVVVPRQ